MLRLKRFLFIVYAIVAAGVFIGAVVSPQFRARTNASAPLRDALLPPPDTIMVSVLYSTEKDAWLKSGVIEGGETRLYDAVQQAYTDLVKDGDPKHIRAVVVLTDGKDTQSTASLQDVMQQIAASGGEGGNAIKLFTIAFGDDADKDVLKQLAEPTGGQQYSSDPSDIMKVYGEIATFF